MAVIFQLIAIILSESVTGTLIFYNVAIRQYYVMKENDYSFIQLNWLTIVSNVYGM